MAGERIALIAREGESTWILYNALCQTYVVEVLLEAPPSIARLARSRIRRLGLWRVVGQLLFQVLVRVPMAHISRSRKRAIMREYGASSTAPRPDRVKHTDSVNSPACWAQVKEWGPQIIVINGTSILSKDTLEAFSVPVVNTHVGITPQYRGVHGAYWALVSDDLEHCGVTVHLVDTGIDTGGVLQQALIAPTHKDNFTTYPTLQMAVGSRLLHQAVGDMIMGTACTMPSTGRSRLWHHPTLWDYCRNRIWKSVR